MPEPASVAVTIPVYKASPDVDEQQCLERIGHFFQDYPVVLCHPQTLNTDPYRRICPQLHSLPMKDEYFVNIAAYNRLMLSEEFYAAFHNRYNYILICQLDVWIFRNDLPQWLHKDYDYVGAPWFGRTGHLIQYFAVKQGIKAILQALKDRSFHRAVGNGGFSLRKTNTFWEICRQGQPSHWNANEDYFWSFMAKRSNGEKLKLPSDTEAAEFCLETQAHHYMQGGDLPPMAVHAYKKYDYDYWKPFILASRQGV